MKITLKRDTRTKFMVIAADKVFEADKLDDGRYMVHIDKVISVIMEKKNVIEKE